MSKLDLRRQSSINKHVILPGLTAPAGTQGTALGESPEDVNQCIEEAYVEVNES